MKKISGIVLVLFPMFIVAQEPHSHSAGRSIKFPDIPGYKTLACDLHQHTVFSDGSVWPDIRVMEALKDGLDAISLTEHLEYQPHKKDIPHPDRNRSYQIATAEAKSHDLIIIRGSEITRRLPPGHCNAIFIEDANNLLVDDSINVFREAKKQGAFVFWNHPNWIVQQKSGIAVLTDLHKYLIKEKLLDGIEVVNDQTYSDEALQIALDNNLTLMGNSDIHKLVDWDYGIPEGGHRPATLVFAKAKNEEAVKEGLFEKRTVVYFKDLLIGRDEFLIPLIYESLEIVKAKYIGRYDVLSLEINNKTNADFILQNQSGFTFHNSHDVITIKPGNGNIIEVKTGMRLSESELSFEILNAVNAPGKHPVVTWKFSISQ